MSDKERRELREDDPGEVRSEEEEGDGQEEDKGGELASRSAIIGLSYNR